MCYDLFDVTAICDFLPAMVARFLPVTTFFSDVVIALVKSFGLCSSFLTFAALYPSLTACNLKPVGAYISRTMLVAIKVSHSTGAYEAMLPYKLDVL